MSQIAAVRTSAAIDLGVHTSHLDACYCEAMKHGLLSALEKLYSIFGEVIDTKMPVVMMVVYGVGGIAATFAPDGLLDPKLLVPATLLLCSVSRIIASKRTLVPIEDSRHELHQTSFQACLAINNF